MKKMTFRKSLTAAAVTACLSFPAVAVAQDADEKVERIEVTGSRIKQVDMETASPVTTITAEDIQISGEPTVADVLNNASVNSFGSWRGVSGYGSGGSATSNVNMRGLGPNYTLVLLDGRRMPGTSSSSGTAADTSKIPMAIVERIEILREGASAVYGSDAVAGVINIITKKDFTGLQLSYDGERPSVDGGDSDRFTASTGFATNKGNITFTFENYRTDSVFDRELWDYLGASSYSSVPNGEVLNADGTGAGEYVSADVCDSAPNTVASDDGRCLYQFGNVTKFFGDVEQNSILSNFNYNLTRDIQFRGRASASMSETDTRYAGTPVSTNQPTMSADNPMNPMGEELLLSMRSAQIGERDTRTEINNIDFLGGLVGYWDIGNGVDWEVNGQYSKSTTRAFNSNLVNDRDIQRMINSGEYDIFNTTGMTFDEWNSQMTELYSGAAHTGLYRAEFDSTQIDGFLSTLLFDNGTVSMSGLVGAEFERIDFTQQSDPQSASGNISGGSGGDDVFADRDRTSVYAELQTSLPYNIDVNAAVRYDEYDQQGDVGGEVVGGTFDNVAPQLGIAWRATDSLLLRASWGESFRAPNMGEMFASEALSFETAVDTMWCDNPNNSDPVYCDERGTQHKTWFGGTPDLQPEEGESLTVGAVYNITNNWSAELSYYDVKLDNKIEAISVDRLLQEEREGGIGSNPLVVREGGDGKITAMYSYNENMASLETSGFDFKTNYNLSTQYGNIGVKGEASYVRDYVEVTREGAAPFDYAGIQDYPELRANVAVNWTKDSWGAAWTTYYIGPQDSGNEEYGVDYLQAIPSYVKHNAQVSYTNSMDGRFTVGVNNVFDKEPTGWYDGFRDYRDVTWSLYDVLGRTVFFKYEQSF
ncbi:TonB-dependent receptor [Idiomarina sp. X4]|uniref:TonB-dependent receptor n=1 Tax=Idiomarina sp. X4 TaxID=2055892 RepID=UPI000C28549F|nr:TonB-dependent receptor [Idiomarina sp. X4]ATZ72562.1 TonB-dependent receptor [Idiomarina sp. X4]